MRAVFDLDDTISVHRNRDYERARPITDTIEKIRKLKSDGWEIIIYSARGQNSCNGDLGLIEKRNRETAERWLSENAVPYDELRFGKPLGDVYIDDKGTGLEAFLSEDYEPLSGNSGAEIYRIGKRVLKECSTAQQEAEWYKEAERIGLKVPKVHSVVLGKIDLEFIDGEPGYKRLLTSRDLCDAVSQILLMGFHKAGAKFDFSDYLRFVSSRIRLAGWEDRFQDLLSYLHYHRRFEATFSHGDYSLSNLIFTQSGAYIIDPSARREYSSYLIDFAKLRFSLDGGEQLLHGGEQSGGYSGLIKELDAILNENNILREVIALEATHWIRMTGYFNSEEERKMIRRKTEKLEGQL